MNYAPASVSMGPKSEKNEKYSFPFLIYHYKVLRFCVFSDGDVYS